MGDTLFDEAPPPGPDGRGSGNASALGPRPERKGSVRLYCRLRLSCHHSTQRGLRP